MRAWGSWRTSSTWPWTSPIPPERYANTPPPSATSTWRIVIAGSKGKGTPTSPRSWLPWKRLNIRVGWRTSAANRARTIDGPSSTRVSCRPASSCSSASRPLQLLQHPKQVQWLVDGEPRPFTGIGGGLGVARGPIHPDADHPQVVGALDIPLQPIANHHRARVVWGVNRQSLQGMSEHAPIRFEGAEQLGDGEGLEHLVQAVLLENVGVGAWPAVGHQGQPVGPRSQLLQQLRRAGNELAPQRGQGGVLDLAVLLHQGVAEVEADGHNVWGH